MIALNVDHTKLERHDTNCLLGQENDTNCLLGQENDTNCLLGQENLKKGAAE
jgi:hypothetical protein